MRSAVALLLSLVVFLPCPTRGGQLQTSGQTPDGSIDLGTTEVAVDLVVKDKDGRMVTGLKPEDFSVAEDGDAQDITSLKFVSGQNATLADSPIGVSCIALVFDRLSPEARNRARQAALKLVGEGTNADLFGVFAIDLSMHVAQPFTYDKPLVRAAIERIGETSTATFSSSQQQVLELADREQTLQQQLDTSRNPNAPIGDTNQTGTNIGAAGAELTATQMTLRSLETFDRLERDEQGHATTNGLLSVVSALAALPGRKALVFFSEGIDLPENVDLDFQAVIGNANRVNVSIYTVDAAGLRATSIISETATALTSAGNRRINQNASGRAPTDGPLMRSVERNEELLRAAPEHSLGELANATGGVFITGTNDPGARLRQVDDDLRSHYVLTYAPKNRNFDGKFRNIAVKIRHSGYEVQARKGYYAIEGVGLSTVLPSEARPLAVLLGGHATGTVHPRLECLCFPEDGPNGLAQVFVKVPLKDMTCSTDAKTKTFGTDFTIVAIVRDSDNHVVEKLSNRYRLGGATSKIDAFKKGDVLFFREAALAPGAYTLEVIAYDVASGGSGVQRASLMVPATQGLRMSSVVIVDRAEALSTEEQAKPNPLHVDGTLLYPNLGTPISKSRAGKLAFFTTVYASAGDSPKLSIDVLRNGQPVARVPADLPAADTTGRIRFANALSLAAFEPGVYELRMTTTEGASSMSRTATFVVAP